MKKQPCHPQNPHSPCPCYPYIHIHPCPCPNSIHGVGRRWIVACPDCSVTYLEFTFLFFKKVIEKEEWNWRNQPT